MAVNEGTLIDQSSPNAQGFEDGGGNPVFSNLDEDQEVFMGEKGDDPTRDTTKWPLKKWIFGKLLSVVRSYSPARTEDEFTDDQHIVNKLYAAANKTERRNSTTVTFAEDGTGVDSTTTLSGNLTLDFTGAKNGARVIIRHNSGTEPTITPTPIRIGGTDYATGVNNLIFLQYIYDGSTDVVFSWITQENATSQAQGGTIDAHTHSRLSVLEAITDAGGGVIPSAAQLAKLDSIVTGYVGFFTTPVALNTAYPSPTANQFAKVNSTNTVWVESSGAWVDSGGNDASVVISAAQVKTLYESNADTNAYTDTEKSKLASLDVSSLQLIPNLVSTSITAANDNVYNNTANATYTDPTGVEGRGYIVRVLAGTATIGGVGYVAGDVVSRMYISAAWVSRVYQEPAGGGGLTLLETKTLVSDASIVSFTGLDTAADLSDTEGYIIFIEGAQTFNTISAYDVRFRFNSDSGSNYYQNNSTSTQTYLNTTARLGTDLGVLSIAKIFIPTPKLRPVFTTEINSYYISASKPYTASGASQQLTQSEHAWNGAANITEINVFLAFGDIAAGSIIKLYKGELT